MSFSCTVKTEAWTEDCVLVIKDFEARDDGGI